jgi:hypothetical protein
MMENKLRPPLPPFTLETATRLHLIVRTGGRPTVAASAYLGDRVELTSLDFVADTIAVGLVTQGPSDPLCCPTMVVDRKFLREGSTTALREVGERQ